VIRVVVAEDSVTVRELLTEILDSDREITVVGQAKNGLEAVELTESLKPDLVTMDVHMPVMDGLAATKEIMVRAPTPILIVTGSAREPDVSLSLNAIRAGALMVVSTPDDPQSPAFEKRRSELLAMAKAMAHVKVVRRWGASVVGDGHPTPRRALPDARHRLVAIAASTGGPAALQRVLQDLPGDFPVPILVVQHIAAGFVGGLADWLGSTCALRVKVAESGEPLARRTVYLAPDDRHLGVRLDQRILLSDEPPISGFRPSADFLFETAARVSAGAMTAVMLTGMGTDGVTGLHVVKSCGGRVVAQDEATSVVYGMPQAAAAAGLVDWKLSIRDVGPRLMELVVRGEHGNSRPRR
jgi:two-component system chemotaxis response regulator CheB